MSLFTHIVGKPDDHVSVDVVDEQFSDTTPEEPRLLGILSEILSQIFFSIFAVPLLEPKIFKIEFPLAVLKLLKFFVGELLEPKQKERRCAKHQATFRISSFLEKFASPSKGCNKIDCSFFCKLTSQLLRRVTNRAKYEEDSIFTKEISMISQNF